MGAIENIIKCLNKQNIYSAYKFPKAEFEDQLVPKLLQTRPEIKGINA